jgi:hypothetical protein
MSQEIVKKLIADIVNDPIAAERLRTDPDAVLNHLDLTDQEKLSLKELDIAALQKTAKSLKVMSGSIGSVWIK